MKKNATEKFEFWKEYPERDTEYVSYYPPSVSKISAMDVWQKNWRGLYLHIPFCRHICYYCPFNKYLWNEQKAQQYLEAVKLEIDLLSSKHSIQNSTLFAVNFGGGTPTSYSPAELHGLLEHCRKSFDIDAHAEITMEANPETVDEERLADLFEIGVNRLSFGVQSFNERFLSVIGRKHKAIQSETALKNARKVGFRNIGIDLMYNIPGQTLDDWEQDLKQAVDLELDHISLFSLFVCPGTNLFEKRQRNHVPPQPEQEQELVMYEKAIQVLTSAGYHQYTVYDFALDTKECTYHKMSWQAPQGEYCGVGPGANSHINHFVYTNISALDTYIATVNSHHIPISFGRKMTPEDEISRFMVLGVKFLTVSKEKFKNCFGIEMESVFGDTIKQLADWGLLVNHPGSVELTHQGKIYVSNVSKAFYTREHRYVPQPIEIEVQKQESRESRV